MSTEMKDLQREITRENARKTLVDARATLERAIREMDRYLETFDRAEHDRDRASALNWAINYLATSVLGNVRLDLIANQQAKLMRIAD